MQAVTGHKSDLASGVNFWLNGPFPIACIVQDEAQVKGLLAYVLLCVGQLQTTCFVFI